QEGRDRPNEEGAREVARADRPSREAALERGVPQAQARARPGDRGKARRAQGQAHGTRRPPEGTRLVKLGDLLKEGQIATGFQARDQWEAITKMVDLLISQGRLKADQKEAVYGALAARENI